MSINKVFIVWFNSIPTSPLWDTEEKAIERATELRLEYPIAAVTFNEWEVK